MSGYCDCVCCGEVTIDSDLCHDCIAAGCDDSGKEACDVPRCEHCDTEASYLTDRMWHSNCDEDCSNAGKSWADPNATDPYDPDLIVARVEARASGKEA